MVAAMEEAAKMVGLGGLETVVAIAIVETVEEE